MFPNVFISTKYKVHQAMKMLFFFKNWFTFTYFYLEKTICHISASSFYLLY